MTGVCSPPPTDLWISVHIVGFKNKELTIRDSYWSSDCIPNICGDVRIFAMLFVGRWIVVDCLFPDCHFIKITLPTYVLLFVVVKMYHKYNSRTWQSKAFPFPLRHNIKTASETFNESHLDFLPHIRAMGCWKELIYLLSYRPTRWALSH